MAYPLHEDTSPHILFISLFAVALIGTLLLWGCPQYRVYSQEMTGKAELAQAEYNRQVKTLEARQSSIFLAQAEVERAKGVALATYPVKVVRTAICS